VKRLVTVALVAAATLVLGAGLARAQVTTLAPTAPAAAPPGVHLVAQSTWVPLGGEFVMRLHLDNPVLAMRPGATIAVRVGGSTISRTGFDAVIHDGDIGNSLLTPDPIPVASLHPDAHHDVTVAFGLPGSDVRPLLNVRRSGGVYPVAVQLTNTGTPSGAFVTWLVVVDTSTPHPVADPLAVSFVWPMVAPPARIPDGSLDASVTAQMQPGGRLDRIATVFARAGSFPYSVVVGPETVETWQRIARSDRKDEAGFARVRAAVARSTTELLPTSYVPIDDVALEAAGLGDVLPAQWAAGARTLRAVLGHAPAAAEATFLDPASDSAVDRMRAMHVNKVAVRDTALIPITENRTPAQTFELDTAVGNAVGKSRSAQTASFVEDLLTTNDPPALKAERALAAIAEVAYESPGLARGLLIAPAPDWTPDVAALTTLIDGLRNDPLVQPTTLDGFFDAVSSEQADSVDVERHLQPVEPSATPLTSDEYNQAVQQLDAYRDVVGPRDPVVVDGERALRLVLSTSITGDRAHAMLAHIDTGIHGFTNAITADAKRITLTSRRARVPLTFVNAVSPARPVTVRIHLDSAKLQFPTGSDQVVTLKPGNNTVTFDVEARTSGTFPMTITLSSADGALAFGAPVRVTVRSAVFGGAAVALTVAALVFLALWWANHFRRSRRARRTASSRAPTPAPAT